MRLEHWLSQHEVTQAVFASRVGVSSGRIAQLVTNRGLPSAKLMAKIADATDGAVTLHDWVAAKTPEVAA